MEYTCKAPRLTKFADPTVDFAFKRIFGTEKYKAATIGLLNSIIPDKNIRDITFINVEIPGMTEDGRKAFIDVLCTSDDGSTFVCEMQNLGHERFLQRMVFYAATLIANTAVRGDSWGFDLKPTYVIAFLNFDIERFANIPGQKDRYTLTYVCREVERGDVLPSSPEFHFIELEKFRKNSPRVSGELEKWLHLLSSAGNLTEIPREFSGSTAFDAYFEAAATAAFSKDELAVYIKDMTTKWDIELAMKEHFEDGIQKGREEGLQEGVQKGREEGLQEGVQKGREEGVQEGILKGREDAVAEMAGRMLAVGVSVDIIAKATGLTPEQIQSL